MATKNPIYIFSLVIILLAQFLTAIMVDTGALLSIIWSVWIAICVYYAFLICSEKMTLKNNTFACILLLFWVINAISYLLSPKHVSSYLFEVDTLIIFKSIIGGPMGILTTYLTHIRRVL